MRTLLTRRTSKPANLTDLASTPDIRSSLRLDPDTALLAVLTAQDYVLEAFWAMDRRPFFNSLRAHRFDAVVGPTYSLYMDGPERPAAHNVLQLVRHSHILDELSRAGLTYIPNLYFRSPTDRNLLVRWLQDRTDIATVYRDLALITTPSQIQSELTGLVQLLDKVGRYFSVLVTGIGYQRTAHVIEVLAKSGHACSIISDEPIMKAHFGHSVTGKPSMLPKIRLYQKNLLRMDARARRAANQSSLYNRTPTERINVVAV